MGCCSSQPAGENKPGQAQDASGPKAAASGAVGAARPAATPAANTAPLTGSKTSTSAVGGNSSAVQTSGANNTGSSDQASGKLPAGVPSGAVRQASGGTNGGASAAGPSDASNGAFAAGSPTPAGAGSGGVVSSPVRPKSSGSPKPTDRPRWGSTPAAAAAQSRKGSGRLSANDGSPAPGTPPRRHTASNTVGGHTVGSYDNTPEQRRATTPSYMLPTKSSEFKQRTASPGNKGRNEGRRPYGLLEPSSGDEQSQA